MNNLSILRGSYIENLIFEIMNRKISKSKPREFTISSAELSRFGIGVMNKALKVVNSAKKGKITIRLERE